MFGSDLCRCDESLMRQPSLSRLSKHLELSAFWITPAHSSRLLETTWTDRKSLDRLTFPCDKQTVLAVCKALYRWQVEQFCHV